MTKLEGAKLILKNGRCELGAPFSLGCPTETLCTFCRFTTPGEASPWQNEKGFGARTAEALAFFRNYVKQHALDPLTQSLAQPEPSSKSLLQIYDNLSASAPDAFALRYWEEADSGASPQTCFRRARRTLRSL